MKHSLLPAAGLAAAVLVSSAAAPAAGTAPAGDRGPAAHVTMAVSPAPGSTTAVLALPTGDRVLARMTPGGPGTVSVLGRPDSRRATSLMTVHTDGKDLVIPLAALSYLGHGLDPSLFDAGALAHAERAGRLPVTLHYRGTCTPRPESPSPTPGPARRTGTSPRRRPPGSARRWPAS